tara:strand:- start:111 stop:2633 length:2523 start_codon:yes stop_codon:yes gene_type:complete
MRAIGLLAACLTFLGVSTAQAADIYVPDDFASIQQAIDFSQNGDVVYIRSGYYTVSNLNTNGKAISIIGLDTTEDGYPAAELSGGYSSSVFIFNSGETFDTRISNLTIRDGWSETNGVGSGIDCRGSDPTIEDCFIENNYALYGEGLENIFQIQCFDSSPRVSNCTIRWGVGGISFDGESVNGSGSAEVHGCTFESCYRNASMHIRGSNPQVSATTFMNCSRDTSGFNPSYFAGVVQIDDGSPQLLGCTMTSNRLYSVQGGAVCITGSGNTQMLDCIISFNQVYGGDGGGIYVVPSSGHLLELTDTLVCYNSPAQIRGDWTNLGGSSLGWYTLGCENPTWNVPGDFATIQSAIDACQDGDSIGVEAGTYFEDSLDTQGKSVLIEGRLDSNGNPLVTIDAKQNGPVFIFQSSETNGTVLSNLILTGGSSSQGGGVRCINGSNPSLRRCFIVQNQAVEGGGVYCSQSDPAMIRCEIRGNIAVQNGGGIFCIAGSSPSIYQMKLQDNTAGFRGGGLYSTGNGSPFLSSNSFNPSNIYSYLSTIEGNSAAIEGGGIWIGDNTSGYPLIRRFFIRNNESVTGAGMYLEESSVGVLKCDISDNRGTIGGGIALGSNSIGVHTISGCRLIGNTAIDLGGGVSALPGSYGEIYTSTLQFNSAQEGAGLHCDVSSILDLAFDAIVGNHLLDEDETAVGGLEIEAGALVTMRGTYLACNDGEQLDGTYENDTDDYNTIGSCSNCPADATGDNVVDVNDVLYVISVWETSDPAGDLDDDGLVAVNDILMLLDAYGDDCSEDSDGHSPYSYGYYYYYYYYYGLRVFGEEAVWVSPLAMASLLGVFVLVRVRR